MPILEAYPCILVLSSTLFTIELKIYLIVDEHYISWWSYFDISTFILTSFWIELFSCMMSNYSWWGCVGLGALGAIWISDCSSMVLGLFVIATSIKDKMSDQPSYFIIWWLEFSPVFYVIKVFKQRITNQP